MCTARPVEVYTNYVTGNNTEPYALCRFVNKDGLCEDFSPGHNILEPKDGPEKA